MVRKNQTTILLVMGMSDDNARQQVLDALTDIPGVIDVEVSLMRSRAVVVHHVACPLSSLLSPIVELGLGVALDESKATGVSPSDQRIIGQ